MSIQELIEYLRHNGGLLTGPVAVFGAEPLVFSCLISQEGATDAEIKAHRDCPHDLRTFWRVARSAILFLDTTYGQWGLKILAPPECDAATLAFAESRRTDYLAGDRVVGEFLGDAELVVLRCDSAAPDFGAVIVAGPLDPRPDWDVVANSFESFLDQYTSAAGGKYWTQSR